MLSNLPQLLLIEMPGGGELLLILVVVLLLFGGKKIPELMRGLGKGIREFNDAKGKITSELEEGMKEKDIVQSRPASSSVSDSYPSHTETSDSPYNSHTETSNTTYTPHTETSDSTYTPHTETTIPSSQSNGKL